VIVAAGATWLGDAEGADVVVRSCRYWTVGPALIVTGAELGLVDTVEVAALATAAVPTAIIRTTTSALTAPITDFIVLLFCTASPL
jgi:hypothetical protein